MNKTPALFATGLLLLLTVALLIWWKSPELAPPPLRKVPSNQASWTLRFGHNTPVDSALHQASVRFAAAVEERSGGRVHIEVYPAQQLGNDHQMVEMARAGELDILLTPTAKMSVPVPAMQYADLPFYFPSREDLYQMLDGEPGQMLLQKLRGIGLVGVTFWENGFKHFTGNRPLHGPEDFEGLRFRTMKSRILMEQFRSLGALPLPIDFHATRDALADGVVDGQENPLVAIVSMGFHEVQSHLTLSSHGYLGYVFSISARTFDKLPPDIRSLLVDTARELTPWERAETHRREKALLEAIRRAGVTVHTLDPEARTRFERKLAHIPALFEPVIGADLLSKTAELLDRKYAADRPERIVIGLNADLSTDAGVSGLAIKRGATLAIEEINATGGVLGKPLYLLARDHKGMPSQGIKNIEQFARQPDIVAVLGGAHSPVVTAELESIHRNGLPFLAAWSAAANVVENGYNPNFVFRISANDRLAAPFVIDYLLKRFQRPAILMENTVWGRGNLKSMEGHLQQRGLKFMRVESFNRGEKAFSPYLSRIEKSGADVIVLIAGPHEGRLAIRALAERAAPLPVISHWGLTGSDFWETNREALEKIELTFFQTFTFLDNPRPLSGHLAERYGVRYGVTSAREILAPVGVAQAYDLVRLLATAIEQAGTTERQAVRDALERLPPVEGAIKRYAPAFTDARHDALGPEDYRMARYAGDGAIVPVNGD